MSDTTPKKYNSKDDVDKLVRYFEDRNQVLTILEYYDEYEKNKNGYLQLKTVEKIYEKEFGISNFKKEEIIELMKSWDSDELRKVNQVKSISELPVSFYTFGRLVSTKLIGSNEKISLKKIVENICVNDKSNLTISEVKYFFESKLGEKLSDVEIKKIFQVVTSQNSIPVDKLIKRIEDLGLMQDEKKKKKKK